MVDFLPDLGFAFIGLALFGFILKDAFNWGLTLKPQTMYKSYITTVFHYVSVALFVFSLAIVIIIMIISAPNPNNPATQFFATLFSIIEGLEKAGALQKGFSVTLTNGLALSFLPAFFYFICISCTILAGRIFRFINNVWIKVEFCEGDVKEYPKMISDDEIFFFFEQSNDSRFWEARRKDEIRRMEIFNHPSKFSDKVEKYYKNLQKLHEHEGMLKVISILFADFGLYFIWALIFIWILSFPPK